MVHQHSTSNVGGDTKSEIILSIIMNSVSTTYLAMVTLQCPLTEMGSSALYIGRNAQDI